MTLVERIRKEQGTILQLDSGDLLFGPEVPTQTPKAEKNAVLIAEVYRTMRVDAINVGDRDLAMGIDFLRELAKKDLPLISANILSKKERKPIFAPYLIRALGGIRVGIFGLSQRPDENFPKEALEGIAVEDPYGAARAVIEEIKEEVDLIICLSDLGKKGDQILAKEVPGIHFILGGHDGSYLRPPIRIDDTLIFQHYQKGMYVGRIDLTVVDRDLTFEDGGVAERLESQVKKIQRQIRDLENLKETTFKEAFVKKLRGRQETIEKKLDEARKSPVKGSRFLHRVVPLGSDLPDHDEWKRIETTVEKGRQDK